MCSRPQAELAAATSKELGTGVLPAAALAVTRATREPLALDALASPARH
jgi:hypothetical protein